MNCELNAMRSERGDDRARQDEGTDYEAAGGPAMLPTDATDQDQDSTGSYGAIPDRATAGSRDVNADPDLAEALDYLKTGEEERGEDSAESS